MTLKKVLSVVGDYALMSLGTLIYCLAWESFMIPNGIASGGLTGACTILQFATGIPVSYSYIISNVILLGIGFLMMGNAFGFRTIWCILLSTVLFQFLPQFPVLQSIPGQPLYVSERILVPIIGGLVEAVGIALIFYRGGSTGGTDIIALILNKFWPVSPGKVFLYIDIFIIATVLLIPGKTLQDMLYGYLAMLSFSFAIDYFLLGSKTSVQVLIFSREYEKIADTINHDMDRGVTALKSVGWYSQQDMRVLLIVVRKTQLPELTRIVKEIDKKAFVSVSPANSVYGEGFEEIKVGPGGLRRRKLGSINQ